LQLHHPILWYIYPIKPQDNGEQTNRTPGLSAPSGFKPDYGPFRGTLQCAQKNRTALMDRPVLCFRVFESTQSTPDGHEAVDYSTGMIAVVASFLAPTNLSTFSARPCFPSTAYTLSGIGQSPQKITILIHDASGNLHVFFVFCLFLFCKFL